MAAKRPSRKLETALQMLGRYGVREWSGDLPGIGLVTLKLEPVAIPPKRVRLQSVPPEVTERHPVPAEVGVSESPGGKDELEFAMDFDGPVPEAIGE